MKSTRLPSPSNPGFDPDDCAHVPGDIVIVGAGLAGLFTALKLAPLPVTVIAAAPLGEGASSAWAQGGIAAAVDETDTTAAHAEDTINAGAGLVDERVAHTVADEAPERIADLLTFGVPFDRDLAGRYILSREAAHSAHRVVRVSGDKAGGAIMQALIAQVRACKSIRVLEGFSAQDLMLADDGRVRGVHLARTTAPKTEHFDLIPARAVILATGGVGGLYAVMTNPPHARGEGLGIAARAGAVIADAEFVQFHPTALDVDADPSPLISEAVRGEGAVLVNRNGERFMRDVHPDAELAPRDIVARAVFAEIDAGRGAFLDCRDAIGDEFADKFPTVFAHCTNAGLNPATELLPVAPAAHYHMGGIATDLDGRSSVPGLWALGEVASTGLHGANRLASNSLLEAVVMGARIAEDITRVIPADDLVHAGLKSRPVTQLRDDEDRGQTIKRLRALMSRDVGVVRTAPGLRRALSALHQIYSSAHSADRALENLTLAAAFITFAALRREESRGAHTRSDFPQTHARSAVRHGLTLAEVLDAMSECARSQESASNASCGDDTAIAGISPALAVT